MRPSPARRDRRQGLTPLHRGKTASGARLNERVFHGDCLPGGDFLGQGRIAFERADNIVDEIAKPAGVCQSRLVARELDIAVDADMRCPVFDRETIQRGCLRLVLIGMNKVHERLSCFVMRGGGRARGVGVLSADAKGEDIRWTC